MIFDGDANGGGIVPYNYRANDFYNAVQWAVGLELFLLIDDPARVFFTTDHPNGAPFTTYPDIFALLMSRDLRAEWIAEAAARRDGGDDAPVDHARIHAHRDRHDDARGAGRRLLGLKDRGHLGAGAVADIAVYADGRDKATMFGAAPRSSSRTASLWCATAR